MAENIKIPVLGEVKKSTAAVGGLAIFGVFLILWNRQRKAAAAAAAATSPAAAATVTDPAGNACAAVNPQTGYCPGTAEDLNAQAQLQGGTLAGYPGSTGFLGQTGQGTLYFDPVTGQYDLTSPYVPPTTGTFTTNQQWSAAAEAAMGSTGADEIAAALGKYLLGQPLTAKQVTSVEQAIAAVGQPPVPGASGYPPAYRTSSSGSGGKGTTPAHTVRAGDGRHSLNTLTGGKGAAAMAFTSQYKPHKSAAEQKFIRAGDAQKVPDAGTSWWVPK